jgi:hypothetical protein
MVKTSVLNDALNAINNAEKSGKRQVLIRPSSKTIIKFLTVMQKHGMHQVFAISLSLLPTPFGLITRQWFRLLHDLCPLSARYINSEELTRLRIFI